MCALDGTVRRMSGLGLPDAETRVVSEPDGIQRGESIYVRNDLQHRDRRSKLLVRAAWSSIKHRGSS